MGNNFPEFPFTPGEDHYSEQIIKHVCPDGSILRQKCDKELLPNGNTKITRWIQLALVDLVDPKKFEIRCWKVETEKFYEWTTDANGRIIAVYTRDVKTGVLENPLVDEKANPPQHWYSTQLADMIAVQRALESGEINDQSKFPGFPLDFPSRHGNLSSTGD